MLFKGVMDFAIAAMPLLLLIGLMTRRKGLPAHYSLPLVAFVLYVLQIFYFRQKWIPIQAAVVSGTLTTATPLLILWGAIFFFKTMENTGSLSLIRRWLNGISPHPVAQLMLIGWAFSFFVEGISGFGTPAVMAAPLLVSLGFEPFRVVVLCLVMNTVPVSFGAVGTPMWFGFGELDLLPQTLQEVRFKTALMHGAAALVIPVMALSIVIPWRKLRLSIPFVYLSILAALGPYILSAKFSSEFPSILGGLSSLLITVYLAKKHVGLSSIASEERQPLDQRLSRAEIFRAFLPFAAVVGLLMLTRMKIFGLQAWLTTGSTWLSIPITTLGEFVISSSLVIELRNILGTGTDWRHPLLYIPSLIPFGVVSLLCIPAFRIPGNSITTAWHESIRRIQQPSLALVGAMVFVKLFMLGGDRAPAFLLGYGLATFAGNFWNFAAVYLGALGSFFAGSCTLSNLTFAPIQAAVASQAGMDLSLALSLQSVGGAMGNMACVHNIVAVCAILGLQYQEGKILRKTALLVLLYGMIAGAVSLILN